MHRLKEKKNKDCISFWTTFKETEHLKWMTNNRLIIDSVFCKKEAENQ